MLTAYLFLIILIPISLGSTVIPSDDCSDLEIFDSTLFTCSSCPENSHSLNNACICDPSFVTIHNPDGTLSCEHCSEPNTSPTPSGDCLYCDAEFDPDTSACSCPFLTQYLTNNGTSLICSDCPPDTARAADSPSFSTCLPCTSLGGGLGIINNQCQCPDTDIYAFGACITQDELSSTSQRFPSFTRVSFHDTPHKDVQSHVLSTLFRPAFIRCQAWHSSMSSLIGKVSLEGRKACQVLSNLCALTGYDLDSAPCEAITYLSRDLLPGNHGQNDWRQEDGIQLVVALYTLEGDFLGFSNSKVLSPCIITESVSSVLQGLNVHEVFGSSTRAECRINLGDLIDNGDVTPAFAEIYLKDEEGLIPVAVRVTSAIENDVKVAAYDSDDVPGQTLSGTYDPANINPDLFLVRRFCLWDSISSRPSATSLPLAVRVIERMHLLYRFQSESKSVRLLPPIMSLVYKEVSTTRFAESVSSLSRYNISKSSFRPPVSVIHGDSSEAQFPSVSFESEFVAESLDFLGYLRGFIWFIAALCIVRWFTDMYSFNKRHPSGNYSILSMIFHGMSSLCLYINNYFGLFLIGLALFVVIIFKYQGTAVFLLPSDTSIAFITPFVTLCTLASFMRLFLLGISFSFSDVFVIDWEQSGEDQSSKISCWRSVYVAKIWSNLQSKRKFSPVFLCICFLLLHMYLDLESLMTAAFDLISDDYLIQSQILKLGTISFNYLIACSMIALINFPFDRWIVQSPINRFLDLLPLTNTSLLVLDEPFCGVYLHGRSIAGKSDVPASSIASFLSAESRGALPARGLSTGITEKTTSDVEGQVFEVFLNGTDRASFDRLWANIARARTRALKQRSSLLKNDRSVREATTFERLGQAFTKSNQFMINWVDQIVTGNHIASQSLIEKWLRLPPPLFGNSLLGKSNESSLKKRTLYGSSIDFGIAEVFAIFWTTSFFGFYPAVLFSFAFSVTVQKIRQFLSIVSIASHTLPISDLVSA
ncbi:hypothetical protein GEMRC1_007565 [Eukaryota sp. GEM-RC1]